MHRWMRTIFGTSGFGLRQEQADFNVMATGHLQNSRVRRGRREERSAIAVASRTSSYRLGNARKKRAAC